MPALTTMVRVFWLVLALTGAAAAQNVESARLFEEGRALVKQGKYADACAKFEKSLALEHATGTLANYADCQEHLGHLAQAWHLFDEAAIASEKEGNVERMNASRKRADALLLKVGTVVVKVAAPETPGLSLAIQGHATTPAAEIREIVDPGQVTVEAAAPDVAPIKKTATVEGGKTIAIEIPALRGQGEPSTAVGHRRRSRVIASFALAGAGGVSLIAGIVVGVIARDRYLQQIDTHHCADTSPPQCDPAGATAMNDAIALANVGTVLGVAGLVLIGGGAAVYLTAPRDLVVTPTATAQSAGLAVVGRF